MSNRISKTLSEKMAVMSFVCACLIVAIHTTSRPLDDTWQWWVVALLGKEGVCRVAVPYFFLASVFFIAGHFGEDGWYGRELCKRIRSLVLPFFAWIIIGKVIKLTVWWGSNLIGYQCGVQYPFEGGLGCSILTMMGLNPCANIGIVWYLRALFFLVIVSPLIYNAIKNLGTLFPLAMFCCYGVYGTILYFTNEWDYFVSIRGIAYFTIGVAIRMGLFDGIVAAKRRNCVAMAILCGGGALLLKIIFWRKGMVMIGNFCDFLMVIPLLYAIWTLCTLVRLPNICTRNSFSIYLMHSDFILISIVGFVIAGQRGIMESSLIATVLRWSFAIFASLFFAELVRRSCPRIASFLFGGR